MASDFQPVTRERHANKKWLPPRDFSFAADRHVLPVVNAEIGNAARGLPLAFIKIGENYTLVAVTGLTPNRNLLVGANGKWLGLYTPAILRSHPFRLARTGDDKLALCVDEASGLVKDMAIGEGGNAFFEAGGNPAGETQKAMEFLSTLQQAEQGTALAVKALDSAGLLEPWSINLGTAEAPKPVGGLFRVNEQALNKLDGDELLGLRKAGALAIAYGQLISMGNIQVLATVMASVDKAQAQRMTIPEKSFLPEDDGSLKIDWNTFLKS